MNFVDYSAKVVYFHSLVLRENTGSPTHVVRHLGISKTTLYELISNLRDCGIEIKYSRIRETFYYVHPERVVIHLAIKQLNISELKNIDGGYAKTLICIF